MQATLRRISGREHPKTALFGLAHQMLAAKLCQDALSTYVRYAFRLSGSSLRSPFRLSPMTLRSTSTGSVLTLRSPFRLSGITLRWLRRLSSISHLPSFSRLRLAEQLVCDILLRYVYWRKKAIVQYCRLPYVQC